MSEKEDRQNDSNIVSGTRNRRLNISTHV